MMQQMRKNTKIIMLVTALAFVALMVFEWGMDMSGQTAGGDVGTVAGTSVTAAQYQQVQRNLYDQVQSSQEEAVSPQQQRQIDDAAWEQVVNQILIRNELEDRGIRVSDDEIRQAALYAPPPEFRSMPEFQNQEGQFDLQLYQQFLSQASTTQPLLLQQLEQYYRESIPRNKLVRQVTAGIYITDSELWREFRDRNEQVRVRFVSLDPAERVPDSEVTVSDAEIEAYYDEHEDDFAVPAQAEVLYTYLDQAPTAQDSIASRETAESIRDEILAGAPFEELAELESADAATAARGGEMDPFSEGEQDPAIEEVAFSIPVGEVSEPIRGPSGYHLLEVLSREDGVVEARQIVVPFERTTDSELQMLALADSLEALGENMTVQQAAAEMGLPVLEGQIAEESGLLPEVGEPVEGRDWIFEDEEGVGAVSPVFETADAFYMLEIVAEYPARTLPLDEVRGQIRESLLVDRKAELAMEDARALATEVSSGGIGLDELAEREGLELQETDMFSRVDNVPGLGQANAAIGAAFGTAPGEIGGPVRQNGRIVLLEVIEREEADREAFEAQKEIQRAQLTQQRQQERLQLWLQGLRESTRIVDARAEFFRAVEEQPEQRQTPMFF